MKKLMLLTLLLVLGCASALAYPSLEEIGEYALVNNPNPQDRLNLRQSPRASSPSLGKYYNGVVCEILEGSAYDEWVRVLIYPSEQEGWMMTRYLAFDHERDQVISAQPAARVKRGARLNLRTGPGESYPVIEPLSSGTEVTVLGVSGSAWAHVQCENLTGYVMTAYLDLEETQGEIWYVDNPASYQRLHLRTGPGKNYASLGLFSNGARVRILKKLYDGWTQVQVGSLVGYMDGNYLSMNGVAPHFTQMTVNNPLPTQRLNLRKEPSVQSASLGRYLNGVKVQVMGYLKGEEWLWVKVGGQEGYMMARFLH